MNTYTNPIKKEGDFADPFVLRYNGRYYLYCTSPGVPCWSSDDLINWKEEGTSVPEEEFPGLVPFAPEVVYWNGAFYMYTSPHGFGHYVLQSSSPCGPFRKITDNIGRNIDISVFVDDDGKWYAYWADDRGIVGCEMLSPTQFGPERPVGVYMNGWTEGPFVVKRDGKYHLTYTGNHFLSKGYRINAAVSDHPLGPYVDHPLNPVVVRTEGEAVGLGHSSTVLGPDLKTYYIIYHNIWEDRRRGLDLDPVVFREDMQFILGPTDTPRTVPQLPMWRNDFKGSAQDAWRVEEERKALPGRGAAEFHLAAHPDTKHYGLIFQGESDVIRLEFERDQDMIILYEGERITASEKIPYRYDHEVLHAVRIEYEETLTVYVDNLKRITAECDLGGCNFDYYADGGLTVGRAAVQDTGLTENLYPVSSAAPCNEENVFEVRSRGEYQIAAFGCEDAGGKLFIDGAEVSDSSRNLESGFLWSRCALDEGRHVIQADTGRIGWVMVNPYYGETTEAFDAKRIGPYGKCRGEQLQTDGEFTASIRISDCQPGWEAGVLFRASQLSDGGEGDDRELGTDFFIGYRVSVSAEGVSLWKHRYDRILLARAEYGCTPEMELHIKFGGNKIIVGLGGDELISYRDKEPVLYGYNGFHAEKCILREGHIR